MPEGDSVYRFAALLRGALEGRPVLAARSHGPGPSPRVERIVGATCTGVRSRGKNLVISFDNGLALRGHLRMYGAWHVYAPGEPWRLPERSMRLAIEVPGAVVVNFNAPEIELIEERALAVHRPLSALGPDLLDDSFDAEEALRRLRDPSRAGLTVGDAIMDQRALAGVGNIWKHETLFRCRVNPWRRVGELDDTTLMALILKAQELLRASTRRPLPGMTAAHHVRLWPHRDAVPPLQHPPAERPTGARPASHHVVPPLPAGRPPVTRRVSGAF